MIDREEDLPARSRALLAPPPLDQLGVAELQDYIAVLESEIARVRGVIAAKAAHRQAAAAFFKKPE